MSSPTFPAYAIFARAAGAQIVDAPRKADFSLDIDLVADFVHRERPRILIICTPNNPTGNATPSVQIEALLRATPHDVLVLFDEAYCEFDPDMDATSLLQAFTAVTGARWNTAPSPGRPASSPPWCITLMSSGRTRRLAA